MRFARILIITAVLGIFVGCGSNSQNSSSTPSSPPTGAASTGASILLVASGGTSTSGSGGAGGSVYIDSRGSVKVLKSGTVDASFPAPSLSPDFGTNPYTVSSNTTVLLDDDASSGNLCNVSGDNNLYIGDGSGVCGDGGDSVVTGLTVNAGATLGLVDQGYDWDMGSGYGVLHLTNDLVINGTVTTDLTQTYGLYIEANVIDVESGGKITVSATTPDSSAGEIYLGYGNGITKQIINHGNIEAKGLGSGNGGYLYFEPDDLVVNYGIIDASGGSSDTSSGGYGGELDIYVDYGDFYSSGTVRMNGGNGVSGGDTEYNAGNWNGYSVSIVTTYADNTRGRNGDIIISGTWEANGGDGTAGNGGYGGYIFLETDALGTVTVNATMSVRGGDSSAAGFTGASTYGIGIYSTLDPYGSGSFTDPTPGKIRIAGQYDLTGGDGDLNGGSGGYLGIYSDASNASNIGSDMELVGFPAMNLNGGEGATGGGSAYNPAFRISTSGNPAGAITNEAKIEAKGGRAAGASGTGGTGGYVEMITGDPSDPTTVINNSGNIDISGGTGDTGGTAYGGGSGDALHLVGQQVTNSGNLTANGGNGTTTGGNGGNITLNSTTPPTTNSGTLSAAGGTGTTPGAPGTRTVDGSGL